MQGSNIQRVESKGIEYAVIVRASLPHSGYNFVSKPEEELQIGVNHYAADATIKPHYHLPCNRSLTKTLEMLHIDSGRASMKLYDDNQIEFLETELNSGDTVVLLRGGHSLKILEPTRIIEVKQGPYFGPEKDKTVFLPKG